MLYKLSSAFYPEDNLQPFLIGYWAAQQRQFAEAVIMLSNTRSRARGVKLFSQILKPSHDILERNKMNGRKPKGNVGRNSRTIRNDNPIQWLNIPLTDEDNSAILADENTLEFHACALLGLVGDGFSVSAKYSPERKSFSVTIYRPGTSDNGRGVGLSAWATDLRLACSVALYKFDVKCGGEFPDPGSADSFDQQRRTFG